MPHVRLNKFRLNGGFKINGASKPFLNHHFLILGFFLKLIPESENVAGFHFWGWKVA